MKKRIKAFSLLEVGVVLFIIGFLSAYLIPVIQRTADSFYRKTVKEQHLKIIESLSEYVLRHRCLPAPSLPNDGFSINSKKVGIVPYKTLNIDERSVKDNKGNWFTYSASPLLVENCKRDPNESDFLDDPSSFLNIKMMDNKLSVDEGQNTESDGIAFVLIAHDKGDGSYLQNGDRSFSQNQDNRQDTGYFITKNTKDIIFWISRNNFSSQFLKLQKKPTTGNSYFLD